MRNGTLDPQSKKKKATQSISLFEVAQLRSGDVILECGSSFISGIIRAADWGKYSHALIFLGGTDFVEAVGNGARIISYVRVPIVNPSDWVVLRHPDAKTAQRAADKARNLVNKQYAFAAVLRSKVPVRFKSDPSRLFCSQLVAVAYERAGEKLVKGKESTQVTPKLLHKKSILKPLDEIPIRTLIGRNIPALDRDAAYADSVMANEMLASQNALRFVRPKLSRLIKALGVAPRPGNLIELLQLLAKAEARGKHEKVTPVLHALEDALGQEKYFELYSTFAKNAEAALLADLEFAESSEAGVEECDYLARQSAEIAATYATALSRCETSARWFEDTSKTSQGSLWSRLAQMYRETSLTLKKLIGIAQSVSHGCASVRLKK
jgi:uncharacterized protein YycO